MCGGTSSGSCDYCQAGMYKDKGGDSQWNDVCAACPTCAGGSYRVDCGAYPFSDDGDCQLCPVGYHKLDNGVWDSGCSECAQGPCNRLPYADRQSHVSPEPTTRLPLNTLASEYILATTNAFGPHMIVGLV